jgi:hypothetical protein
MARPKSDNVQINISIPSEWKKELENLARIYSVEEDKIQNLRNNTTKKKL